MKKIIIFSDPGIDDAVALLYALLNKQLDVLGIVAEYGNTYRDFAVRNTKYLLKTVEQTHIPVFTGSERSLSGKELIIDPAIHGTYGLGPFKPTDGDEAVPENFFDIIPLLEKHGHELTIVTLGRLTSLATLFLLYPNLMKRIREIYIMAGAFFVPGNISPVAEANVYGDPLAASIVIQQAKELTLFPLNVTHQVLITPQQAISIEEKGGPPLIRPLLDFYYKFYEGHIENIAGSPVHDLVPLVALTNPQFFSFDYYRLYVNESDGISKGMTVADLRPYKVLPSAPIHRVAVEINAANVTSHFQHVITS